MIFAFIRHNRYDTHVAANQPPKIVDKEERRFYFNGGKLIRLLIGKKEVKSGDERFDELASEAGSIASAIKTAGENQTP